MKYTIAFNRWESKSCKLERIRNSLVAEGFFSITENRDFDFDFHMEYSFKKRIRDARLKYVYELKKTSKFVFD